MAWLYGELVLLCVHRCYRRSFLMEGSSSIRSHRVVCGREGSYLRGVRGLPELSLLGKRVKTYPGMDVQALVKALEGALSNKEAWRSGGFKTLDSRVSFMEETVTRRYRDAYQGGDSGLIDRKFLLAETTK